MDLNLKDKAVLVTGASRGIGLGIVKQLISAGAKVGLGHSGKVGSEVLIEKIKAEFQNLGGEIIPLAMDLASEEQCKKAVDDFAKAAGGIYGLVNNGGIVADALLLRAKTEDWDKTMDVNLRGTFFMCRSALRYMLKQENGASIVNMSSVVGLSGHAGQSVYSASKSGLIGFTKSLAQEVASRHIRVNVIAPGFIETDMTSSLNAEQRESLSKKIPLGFLGQADDIAHAALYLLSPNSRYVTGQILSVNGGLYM